VANLIDLRLSATSITYSKRGQDVTPHQYSDGIEKTALAPTILSREYIHVTFERELRLVTKALDVLKYH